MFSFLCKTCEMSVAPEQVKQPVDACVKGTVPSLLILFNVNETSLKYLKVRVFFSLMYILSDCCLIQDCSSLTQIEKQEVFLSKSVQMS